MTKIAVTAASGKLGAAILSATASVVGPAALVAVARTPAKAQGLGVAVRAGDDDAPDQLNAPSRGSARCCWSLEWHHQTSASANIGFGWAVAIADTSGNGYGDILIGAPNEAPGNDPTSGGAFHFVGTPWGPFASAFIDQE